MPRKVSGSNQSRRREEVDKYTGTKVEKLFLPGCKTCLPDSIYTCLPVHLCTYLLVYLSTALPAYFIITFVQASIHASRFSAMTSGARVAVCSGAWAYLVNSSGKAASGLT